MKIDRERFLTGYLRQEVTFHALNGHAVANAFMLDPECDLIAAHVAPGASAEELRHHMRMVAKSGWRYVNWLTHAQNAEPFDAVVALETTHEILGLFSTAIIRK